MAFYDPRMRVAVTRDQLPHWHADKAAMYFITYRLGDALPHEKWELWLAQRDDWRARHPEPWPPEVEAEFHRRFSRQVEEWLDAGHGACVLREHRVAEAVAKVWRDDEAAGSCRFAAWVVMPNHVHVVAELAPGTGIGETVKRWKAVSTRTVNALLGRSGGGLWQRDYFDRLVRGPEHFERCVRYVRANPAKAGLRAGDWIAYEAEDARAVV
jgi:REP element-mobilizing transposase RayT